MCVRCLFEPWFARTVRLLDLLFGIGLREVDSVVCSSALGGEDIGIFLNWLRDRRERCVLSRYCVERRSGIIRSMDWGRRLVVHKSKIETDISDAKKGRERERKENDEG